MSFIFHSILLLKFKINITQGSKQKDNKGKLNVKGSEVEKKKHDNLKRLKRSIRIKQSGKRKEEKTCL